MSSSRRSYRWWWQLAETKNPNWPLGMGVMKSSRAQMWSSHPRRMALSLSKLPWPLASVCILVPKVLSTPSSTVYENIGNLWTYIITPGHCLSISFGNCYFFGQNLNCKRIWELESCLHALTYLIESEYLTISFSETIVESSLVQWDRQILLYLILWQVLYAVLKNISLIRRRPALWWEETGQSSGLNREIRGVFMFIKWTLFLKSDQYRKVCNNLI